MTTTIDPNIRADVLRMAHAGANIRDIGNETGLLDKEIRLIVDGEKRRLAENPQTAQARTHLPPTRRAPQPPTAPPRLPSGAVRPPIARPAPAPVAPPEPSHIAPQPADSIAALIDQAEASDIGKVRTAARRAVAAIDQLREVMDVTETERREKAAAKAKAEKEKAERAEKERIARVFRDELARQLEKAEVDLAELTGNPTKKPRRQLSPAALEAVRANGVKARAARAAKRAASA